MVRDGYHLNNNPPIPPTLFRSVAQAGAATPSHGDENTLPVGNPPVQSHAIYYSPKPTYPPLLGTHNTTTTTIHPISSTLRMDGYPPPYIWRSGQYLIVSSIVCHEFQHLSKKYLRKRTNGPFVFRFSIWNSIKQAMNQSKTYLGSSIVKGPIFGTIFSKLFLICATDKDKALRCKQSMKVSLSNGS